MERLNQKTLRGPSVGFFHAVSRGRNNFTLNVQPIIVHVNQAKVEVSLLRSKSSQSCCRFERPPPRKRHRTDGDYPARSGKWHLQGGLSWQSMNPFDERISSTILTQSIIGYTCIPCRGGSATPVVCSTRYDHRLCQNPCSPCAQRQLYRLPQSNVCHVLCGDL